MLACVCVCLSVVSRAAWEGDMASIRLGLIWAGPLLSAQGPWRTELQMGAPGTGCIFPLSLGTPRERVGATSSLELRVRGAAQAVWAHLALVQRPLVLTDPKAHLLLLRACGQGDVSALPTPWAGMCLLGYVCGCGVTCLGLWSVRDLFTCWAPGRVSAYGSGVSSCLP